MSNKDNFKDSASAEKQLEAATNAIMDSVLDWPTARKHDGYNIPAGDWAKISDTVERKLKESVPDIKINEAIFGDFDSLAVSTRNLNMMEITAKAVIKAHLYAHVTGDQERLATVAKDLQRKVAYFERHGSDVPHVPITHLLAKMLEGGNDTLRRKQDVVDVTRASKLG